MSSTDPRPDATGSAAAGPTATGGSTSAGPAPTGTDRTAGTTDAGTPQPQGPRTTGAKGHVVGALLGVGLTLVALVVLALGMSRVLGAAGGGGAGTVSADALGMVLVTVGALLAGAVALLAVRTSTIPLAGGLLAVVLGAAYLFAPVDTHRETVRLLATQQNREGLLNVITVATTGVVFTVGVVLLGAAFGASMVRRRGIEVGSFRERTRAGRR